MTEPVTLLETQPAAEQLGAPPEPTHLPEAYRLPDGASRAAAMGAMPGVVFVEVTNRCNLRCETCPRTYFTREPLKTLTFDEFCAITGQFPSMRRCALHGIGEPLLNRHLPRMIEFLKRRGVEVLFNSNGTLLTPAWQEALVRSGLDEYRCSVDGARAETYARIRGADLLRKVLDGLAGLVQTKARLGAAEPRVSIWCVATRENLGELPDLVRLAAGLGVPEVYLQRMTYFSQEPERQFGMARHELAVFDAVLDHQEEIIAACEALGEQLGVGFRASGARDARASLAARRPAESAPWRACLRPWTTAYITANGNCLPCCISPFSTTDYDSLILGNLFQRPFAEIWNDPAYRSFRTRLLSLDPNPACAGCGVCWSL